ncbi:glutaredoxin [Candidatus Uhrbacteria bacterium]|nr:glutaredoxin [Candidatus Uhrbacteria bacterium]
MKLTRLAKASFFMNIFFRLAIIGSVLLIAGMAENSSYAQTSDEPSISSFVRDDCKHCLDQKEFFEKLGHERQIRFYYHTIEDSSQKELFEQIAKRYGMTQGTPITLVGDKLVQGFQDEATTGNLIRRILDEHEGPFFRFEDIREGGARLANEFTSASSCEDECPIVNERSYIVKIPLIGRTVDVGAFSLAALSLTLGFIDGFNPCALWVLVMFLFILSQVGSRRRMWEYAGVFILAQAVMYYLILTVWLTAWDFIGLNRIVTPLIGLLALGSGVYFLYKFITFKPVCSVTSVEEQQTIANKIKRLAKKPLSFGVFLAIVGIAFSVNIFEFACSIGIPQTFTKILELNNLDWVWTQWYLLLYMAMYMIDDILVFFIGLYSIEKIGSTYTYSKWSTLIGGILMILIGIIMLARPALLVF